MAKEPASTEETAVVAAYTSRHDAEMARSFLEDQGIRAFVAADDVHPPMQLTEGARLRVMKSQAAKAAEALDAADMRSAPTTSAATAGAGVRSTAWAYLIVFALVLVVVVAGVVYTLG